jgi:hypothetical protein
MTRTSALLALSAPLFVCLLASSAQAQTAIRTYVSVSGSDSNPCSLTAPCRHFSAAATATAAGGEVDALDPGGYGSFTISQAITIDGQGWSYVAPPTGGNGITITAGSGNVTIRGVSFNGVGVTGSPNGISFTGGGTLDIQNSVIENFGGDGVFVQPSAAGQLFLSNTQLLNNGRNGVEINTTASITGAFDHVRSANNFMNGIDVFSSGTSPTISFSVSNSAITNNISQCGITASASAGLMTVSVSDSVIENNIAGVCPSVSGAGTTNFALRNSIIAGSVGPDSGGYAIINSGATVWVTRSTINGNNNGILTETGHTYSYGDNALFDNGTPSTFSTPTPTYQ